MPPSQEASHGYDAGRGLRKEVAKELVSSLAADFRRNIRLFICLAS